MADLSPEQKEEDRTERTALANDRTLLASERTLAAWWRTALAALAVAVGLSRLFEEVDRILLVRAAATLPILLALLVLFIAVRRYARIARGIETNSVDRVPRAELWIGTGLLTLLSAAAAAIVWGLF
jgi:putative membrane protein